MRHMSEAALSAIEGSRTDVGIIAHVWYDGVCVAQDVDVSSWTVTSEAERQVQTQVGLTINDPTGALAPWGVDDPLGVGGSRVQLIYAMNDSERIDMGFFRITKSDAVEHWNLLRVKDPVTGVESRQVWLSGGARIPISAEDLTTIVVADKFVAPESPKLGATVLSEVRRLLFGVMPVTVQPGIVDRDANLTMVYERERMDAVEDLLRSIGCACRMTGDGQLEVYSSAPGDSVWTIAGGDDGVLVGFSRSQDVSDMFNGAVAEGATSEGNQLIARQFELDGPLRWGGPNWRRPKFQSSTGILETQEQVEKAAVTVLRGQVEGRTVDLVVTCLPHPGLQPGDVVTLEAPTPTGEAMALTGIVRSTALSGSTAGVTPMNLTMRCSYDDVQAVSWAIRKGVDE